MGVDVKTGGAWQEVADRTPTGVVSAFAGTTAPAGWLLCDGAAVSRATYATLFSAIGIAWGAGDETTTFNVPDLRGVGLVGSGDHGTATKANGTPYDGPDVGVIENDQMQGHYHNQYAGALIASGGGPDRALSATTNTNIRGADAIRDPIDDGVNDNPSTGDETRPAAAGVNFIIKT